MSNNEHQEEIIALIKSGKKISAIKILREADGLSLYDAKTKVEDLQKMLIDAGELDASAAKSGCLALLLSLSFFACVVLAVSLQ